MSVTLKTRSISLASMALAMAACSALSDANADTGERADSKTATAQTATAPSSAATRPVALPPAALAAWESYARQVCRTIGERFTPVRFTPLAQGIAVDRPGRGGFVGADFNGDGQPDFVVVTAGQGCTGGGPGAEAVDFILSDAGGYGAMEGFAGSFDAAMVKRRDGRDVVEYPAGFFGNCGEVTAAIWGWNGEEMDVIERRNSEHERVDQEGCAVRAQPAAAADTGASSFPPIEAGYWAGGVGCAEAIEEAAELPPDQGSLWHIDGKGGWIGRFEIQRYVALGGNRYRLIGRDHTEIGSSPGQMDITVDSRTRFSARFDDGYSASFTHCPASTIPASIRSDFEGR